VLPWLLARPRTHSTGRDTPSLKNRASYLVLMDRMDLQGSGRRRITSSAIGEEHRSRYSEVGL
jgi:hypothetical protein